MESDPKPLDSAAPDSVYQPVPTDADHQPNIPQPSGEASRESVPAEDRAQATPPQSLESQISAFVAQARTEQPSGTPQEYGQTPRSTPPTTNPSAETPEPFKPKLTETDILRERLKRDPLDVSTRQHLIGLAEASGDVERIQEAYEGLLEVFPNAVRILE